MIKNHVLTTLSSSTITFYIVVCYLLSRINEPNVFCTVNNYTFVADVNPVNQVLLNKQTFSFFCFKLCFKTVNLFSSMVLIVERLYCVIQFCVFKEAGFYIQIYNHNPCWPVRG